MSVYFCVRTFTTRQRIGEILPVLRENVHLGYPFQPIERRHRERKRKLFLGTSIGKRKPHNLLHNDRRKKIGQNRTVQKDM
jgi:hypothetical protein